MRRRTYYRNPPILREMRLRNNPVISKITLEIRNGDTLLKTCKRTIYSEFRDGSGRPLVRHENINYELHMEKNNVYFIDVIEILE